MRVSAFQCQFLSSLPQGGRHLLRPGRQFYPSHVSKRGLRGGGPSLRSVSLCLWALTLFSIWPPVALAQDVSVTARAIA